VVVKFVCGIMKGWCWPLSELGFAWRPMNIQAKAFTQRRVRELIALGFGFGRALEIVSQELGHFRPSITRAYLR
jgi:hypothetical protein